MIFLKIVLWIVAVVMILFLPVAAFGASMSTTPNTSAGLIPVVVAIAGLVLAVLLIMGRIG